ncbi:MAG: DUF1707 and FHA domain-containing protein [Gaiellaceae bacterium]
MNLGVPAYLPSRPSAVEREKAIAALNASRAAERLSLDTFSARVELALTATSRSQLTELLADLPGHRSLGTYLLNAVSRTSAWIARVELAWRQARLPQLPLPQRENVTLGRSHNCDCVVIDSSVSRRHASLRREGAKWWLSDLDSMNGTFLNGWRIAGDAEVRAGDTIALGRVEYRLTHGLS